MASKPIRILSALEVGKRMEMDLCLLCDEIFTLEHHQLMHKNVRYLVREMDEDEPEQVEDEHQELGLSTSTASTATAIQTPTYSVSKPLNEVLQEQIEHEDEEKLQIVTPTTDPAQIPLPCDSPPFPFDPLMFGDDDTKNLQISNQTQHPIGISKTDFPRFDFQKPSIYISFNRFRSFDPGGPITFLFPPSTASPSSARSSSSVQSRTTPATVDFPAMGPSPGPASGWPWVPRFTRIQNELTVPHELCDGESRREHGSVGLFTDLGHLTDFGVVMGWTSLLMNRRWAQREVHKLHREKKGWLFRIAILFPCFWSERFFDWEMRKLFEEVTLLFLLILQKFRTPCVDIFCTPIEKSYIILIYHPGILEAFLVVHLVVFFSALLLALAMTMKLRLFVILDPLDAHVFFVVEEVYISTVFPKFSEGGFNLFAISFTLAFKLLNLLPMFIIFTNEEGVAITPKYSRIKEVAIKLDDWSKAYGDITLSYLFMMTGHHQFYNLKGIFLNGRTLPDTAADYFKSAIDHRFQLVKLMLVLHRKVINWGAVLATKILHKWRDLPLKHGTWDVANTPTLGLYNESFSDLMIEFAVNIVIFVAVNTIGPVQQQLSHQLIHEKALGLLCELLIADPPESRGENDKSYEVHPPGRLWVMEKLQPAPILSNYALDNVQNYMKAIKFYCLEVLWTGVENVVTKSGSVGHTEVIISLLHTVTGCLNCCFSYPTLSTPAYGQVSDYTRFIAVRLHSLFQPLGDVSECLLLASESPSKLLIPCAHLALTDAGIMSLLIPQHVEMGAVFHRKMIDRGRTHVPPVLLKWKTLPLKHGTKMISSLRTRMLEGEGIVTVLITVTVPNLVKLNNP